MRRGFVSSSKYSPGNMDRHSLERLFVGRQKAMEDVVGRMVDSVDSENKHYMLLVGPRGSGKTHFVALAMHKIMDALALSNVSGNAAMAVLKEEEWGVASYLDFVVRILKALATQTPELEEAIERIHASFRTDPENSEELAESFLENHLAGRTLVLVCENLIDLFEGLGLEGQKRLRAHMQQSGLWAVLATTPALFAGVMRQSDPFYGFFTVRHLEELDFETASELLVKKAVHADKAELAEFLGTPVGRARTRAIHHLAGGNHRAYIVLFDFLDRQSLDDLIEPFMHMVDDLTPYYQDRMRQLPPAQRKIVEFLAHVSCAVQVKEVAAGCLMSQQTAAKQIGELAAAGFVRRSRLGRSTFCELSEPLMRICIEVKENRSEHFSLFVEFLRHWFSNRELETRVSEMEHQHASDIDQLHLQEAARNLYTGREEPFIEALHTEAKKCLAKRDYSGLATVQEKLVRDSGRAADYHWYVVALREAGATNSAISVGREATEMYKDDATLQFDLARAYLRQDRDEEALQSIDRAILLEPDDLDYVSLRADVLLALERFEDAMETAATRLGKDAGHWQSVSQQVRALVGLDRGKEAAQRADALVKLEANEPRALIPAAEAYYSCDDLDGALRLVEAALAIEPDRLDARHLRGLVYFDLDQHREASKDLRYVIDRHPDSVPAHCRLSDSLLFLSEYEEALEVAERLIELDRDHGHAYAVRGKCLIELDREHEAVAAYDRMMALEDCHSLLLAASELVDIGHSQAATRYLDRVRQLRPNQPSHWIELVRLYTEVGDYDGALDSAREFDSMTEDTLFAQLLMTPALAGRAPLDDVFARVSLSAEISAKRVAGWFGKALAVSVGAFGPKYIVRGLVKALEILAEETEEVILGMILTAFLFESDGVFAGHLDDWETALDGVRDALADRADCRVPMEMLTAAVMYTKTDDKRHLLRLPLEERQLLEESFADVDTE